MKERILISITFIFLYVISTTDSFKTCSEQVFCEEIRNESRWTRFYTDRTSINLFDENQVILKIYDDNSRSFDLTVTSVNEGIFRVKIEDPNKPRYNLKDVLVREPVKNKVGVILYDSYVIIKNDMEDLMVIHYDSLKIEVFKGEDLIVVINGYTWLNYNTDEDNEAVSVDFRFLGTDVAYGIPLHAENLSLQVTANKTLNPYRLFNTDYAMFPIGTKEALYGAVPVLYAHGTKRSSGIFWLNSAQTFIDIDYTYNGDVESLFISQTGPLDIFILSGPTLKDAVKQYTSLTGPMPLPPLFSLGHHQSRWSYMSQEDALTVVEEMDNHDFPFDVIWLDIDYTEGFKYFTWNLEAFPDPVEMQNRIKTTGRKLVLIVDPHIKIEEGYFVYDTATEKGYFVRTRDGTDYSGACWPGKSSWLDFLNPSAADYYSDLFTTFPNTTDIIHIWNDMNEPSVFNLGSLTMPDHNIHYGDVLHGEIHNSYGFYQTKATQEGLIRRYKSTNKRPFVLTRSHFAGSQRFAAVWTGDNIASWEHLKISIPMCLTMSVSGIGFCGADVGGFIGDVTEELLQRWYQTGAWLPFFRAHSSTYVERREPYLYPSDVQTRIRNAIRQRYYNLPLWYTLFYEHERYGEPVLRPLSYHYSSDPNTLAMDNQFLVGRNVLVHPVTDPEATDIQIYLPGGTDEYWYDIVNNLLYFGTGIENINVNLDSTPVFYRGGSIIARLEQHKPSSQFMYDDPYTVYVFLNKDNYAQSTIYFDDYETFEYRENKFSYLQMTYNNGFSITTLDDTANFDRDFKVDKLLVYRHPDSITKRYQEAIIGEQKFPIEHVDDCHFVIKNLMFNFKENGDIKLI